MIRKLCGISAIFDQEVNIQWPWNSYMYVRTNAAAAHAFLHKSLKVDRTTIALEEDQWYVHFTRGGNGQTMEKKKLKYEFCL